MQRVQRKFGSFLPRTADETQIATLLNDFKEADQMLIKIIEGAKAWREAWAAILRHQLFLAAEYEMLYGPILGAMEDHEASHVPVETPQHLLEQVKKLRAVYSELKADMEEEVNTMDVKLIQTAKDAREALAPMQKVIKKREDRKLDYERYKSRVEHIEKKDKRSDRDNVALAKQQIEFEHATQEYQSADSHLRAVLPGIINATFALVPHLLATQISIQNAILAQFYTLLHNYCNEQGFPSPPPEWEDVVSAWDATFTPFRKEVESGFGLIAHGKAVHQPMEHREASKNDSLTGFGIRNGLTGPRKTSAAALIAPDQ
ncbi:hypothetical protein H2199_006600 [Coniosporium tulheliwenetii]|uniref:Uncharacterized protein n=1 Tax=Coniosporium tulheliwenetii TaxID=3383036 RepID=A0ACC2YW82_9PEZI|nr:hypothetical protein H2199_006600 [Cladosporium sp. JES 115]